jgi:meso-butanediol dehydrogenase/(S,S)-butanediol dehydrogenase/diacetyl reductase
VTSDGARVAIVTGGGTGIGAATASALRGEGWDVLVCGRRSEPLEAVCRATGATAVVADVATATGVDKVLEEATRRFGRLDGVVLNAGIVRAGPVGDLSDDDWDEMLSINLTSAFRLARASLPQIIASRGCFVGISSAAGLRATAGIAGYNTTKAGLSMLMQSIAVDYGPAGVRANVVCPGWTRTEMADLEMEELGESIGVGREEAYELASAFTPTRRPGDAVEIGRAVAWLLSPAASYVNAAVLPVDGGLVAVEPGQIAFDPRVAVAMGTESLVADGARSA